MKNTELNLTQRRLAAERIADKRVKCMDTAALEDFARETHYACLKRLDDSGLLRALGDVGLTLRDL